MVKVPNVEGFRTARLFAQMWWIAGLGRLAALEQLATKQIGLRVCRSTSEAIKFYWIRVEGTVMRASQKHRRRSISDHVPLHIGLHAKLRRS